MSFKCLWNANVTFAWMKNRFLIEDPIETLKVTVDLNGGNHKGRQLAFKEFPYPNHLSAETIISLQFFCQN